MGHESSSATTSSSSSSSSSTPSPTGKRNRDPEDEIYIGNLHSHKRYLSQIMASSLNGLTVGDPLPENLMESPARSEPMFYLRDKMLWQYSPMRPVSLYRYQRPSNGFCFGPSTSSYPLNGNVSTVSSLQPRRGSDTEGWFPSSPSDICHSANLRRAALLRSVQMRTQPSDPSSFESPFVPGQENVANVDVEVQPCSFVKSLVDDREYHIEECSTLGITKPKFSQDKSCIVSNMNLKVDESGD